VQTQHIVRHTRRGFFRGDAVPKFFELVSLVSGKQRTVSSAPEAAPAPLPPPTNSNAGTAPSRQASRKQEVFDFHPHPSHLLHNIDGSLSAPEGHAFLSWLADQLTGQAAANSLLAQGVVGPVAVSPVPAANQPELLDFSPDEDYDPSADFLLDDKSLLSADSSSAAFDLSYPIEAAKLREHSKDAFNFAHLSSHIARGRRHPEVIGTPEGGRMEFFEVGSKVVKDVLGRVVEVHCQYGDCLFLKYGAFGKIESFKRTDSQGQTHSQGRKDKHGVVVRDQDGRVRAAGENMTVDPRGCFYLHGIDGQYYCLDLVTAMHSERRNITDENGRARFITSLFTHDGFRMATMFGPPVGSATTGGAGLPRFRFYGRDGTIIEFASEEDLYELKPVVVSVPAARPVHDGWLFQRQAVTAWESVHDYLMRVS
jgi:hypothetical protein